MQRRTLLPLAGSAALVASRLGIGGRVASAASAAVTLASAPIEVRGDWGGSLPGAALAVVSRMRAVSLAGVHLVSDRQPGMIWVDSHLSGPPHIWLHFDGTPIAWIIVDIGARDWSKLAYQFGHELGHVLCNSWGPEAKPANPCQWLEEALVEAFSIRGLGLLAESWEKDPPFPGDGAFGAAIRGYREDLLKKYLKLAEEQGAAVGMPAWFEAQRGALETVGGAGGAARAVLAILAEWEAEAGAAEALGALNRWPGRSGVQIEDYLRLWKRSCAELGAAQRLRFG